MRTLWPKISLCLLALALFSCKDTERFSDRPYLEWREAEFGFIGDSIDNRRILRLQLYFTDGDGDVGSETNNADTCNLNNYQAFLDNYDFFIYYFERVNGEYQAIPPADSCLPFHNILPDLTPRGQNKTLEGDIISPFDYANFPQNNGVDSIRFEFELKDRSGKRSPRIYSPAIAVPR